MVKLLSLIKQGVERYSVGTIDDHNPKIKVNSHACYLWLITNKHMNNN